MGEDSGLGLLAGILCWGCAFLACVSVWATSVGTGSMVWVPDALWFVSFGPDGVQSLGVVFGCVTVRVMYLFSLAGTGSPCPCPAGQVVVWWGLSWLLLRFLVCFPCV